MSRMPMTSVKEKMKPDFLHQEKYFFQCKRSHIFFSRNRPHFTFSLRKQLTLSWHYHWFPYKMTSEKWVLKFHTDDMSLPRSGLRFWLVASYRKITSINQKHLIWVVTRHQYGISGLVSQTSFAGKPMVELQNDDCFLRLQRTWMFVLCLHLCSILFINEPYKIWREDSSFVGQLSFPPACFLFTKNIDDFTHF